MKKMYQSLIRQYANVVAEKVCDGVIEDLKQITTTLSGDDSGLRNTWEEICVQVQGEESFFWDEYQTVMHDAILGAIVAVEQRDLASLWLQSEEGWSWRWDMENADAAAVNDAANAEVTEIPFDQEEIAKYILQKHLLVRAEDYSNQRIAAFLGEDGELDEDDDEVDEDEHDEPDEDERVESKSHQMVVEELNATPLSQHLANLMGGGGGQYLTLVTLAMQAADEQPMQQDPTEIRESLAYLAMVNPQRQYNLLSNPMMWDEPADWIAPLDEAETLGEAIEIMAETLREIYRPLWIHDAYGAR